MLGFGNLAYRDVSTGIWEKSTGYTVNTMFSDCRLGDVVFSLVVSDANYRRRGFIDLVRGLVGKRTRLSSP